MTSRECTHMQPTPTLPSSCLSLLHTLAGPPHAASLCCSPCGPQLPPPAVSFAGPPN